ncbi:MAG: AhpC/TSA family protein [Gammaproteobacteria bacterium]|nr:AhpC/TSA family protein [Gammaproteobacteria bacterium]
MNIGQKLIYGTFVSLFFTAFLCSQSLSVVAADLDRIAPSAAEVNPVKAGEMAPRFTVRTVDDEPYVFDPENLDSPTVIVTFRGGWCPYCNLHLSELKDVVPELQGKGVDVLFLSGDRPEILYNSLKQETQEDIDGMGYTILSDADIDAAKALRIAFRQEQATIDRYENRGMDIAGSSMKNYGVLPVPAVYVIDSNGMVTFSFVEADYKVRLSPADLLAAAGEVAH